VASKREILTERSEDGLLTNQAEFKQVCQAVRAGSSVLVLGEYGSPKLQLANAVKNELQDYNSAIASYQGSLKKLLVELAEQLDIPTTEPKSNQALFSK